MATLTSEEERALLDAGLRGTAIDAQRLVAYLMPVIQARVARSLAASTGGSRRRNLREEVEDLSQEVFTVLFADQAKVLHVWAPERGLSLRNFVGLVARRKANATMAVRKRNPWSEDPMEAEAVERALPDTADAERRLAAKELVAAAMSRTASEQTERGKRLLVLIVQEGRTSAEVAAETGLSDAAVYQWRSRLLKRLRHHLDALMAEDGGAA